jgi:hypothetical protein
VKNKGSFLIIVVVIIAIIAAGGTVFYLHKKNIPELTSNPQTDVKKEEPAHIEQEDTSPKTVIHVPADTKVIRYYAGIIGSDKVHLMYWPHKPEADTSQHAYFDGQYVYDGISSEPIGWGADFTSGGSMSASGYIGEHSIIENFTNESCEGKMPHLCGWWTKMDGTGKTKFDFNPAKPFNIGDFISK